MGQVVGGPMIFWKLPDSFPIELHLRISANLGYIYIYITLSLYCERYALGGCKFGHIMREMPLR